MPSRPLRRRKATVALGMSGDRGSLVADIKADKAQADAEARQAANDAKQAAAESWSKEITRLKNVAQQFQDGEISKSDFDKEIESSKSKFSDHVDDIVAFQGTAVRNKDTQAYNDYVNGAKTFDEFKAYYDSRKKDGGDLKNLDGLLSQARINEDKNQYDLYKNNVISFDQLKQYQQSRMKDGGDVTKLNGYVALAQTNENQINDQLQAAQYNAGGDPQAYKDYLNQRIATAASPKEAQALRTAMQQVSINETLKAADDVQAQYQAGQIDGATAVNRLMSIRSGANDSGTQTKLLGLVGQIQNADKAKAGNATAAVNANVTNMRNLENDAKADLDKAMADIRSKGATAGPADYAKLTDLAYIANNTYAKVTSIAGANVLDPAWKENFNSKVQDTVNGFSSHLFELATTIANNITKKTENETTGSNINKFGDAAKFLIEQASTNPHMSQDDRQRLIDLGRTTLAQGQSEWMNSEQGIQWRDFVDNRTNELMQNNGAGLTAAAQLAQVDPNTIKNPRAFVEQMLLKQPDVIRQALTNAGIRGFADKGIKDNTQGALIKGATPDEFSKQIADLTVGLRTLGEANDELYKQTGQGGLSVVDQAYDRIYNPDGHNTNTGMGDPNEMKYGELAGQRKHAAKNDQLNLRGLRDEGTNQSDYTNATGPNPNPNYPSLSPLNANQREDRFQPPTQTDPNLNMLDYERLKQRVNPYTQDPTTPSPFNVDVQGREDRGVTPVTVGGPKPQLDLQQTALQQNPYAGNDNLQQGADPYAYLQSLLDQRQTEWNITVPQSDIQPPEQSFGGSGGGSLSNGGSDNLLSA